MNGARIGRAVWLATLFSAVHSALASRQAKELAIRIVGARYRNGLYRVLYCLQSIVMLVWATSSFFALPDHLLYRFHAPWSWLMRLGQAASVLLVWRSARVIGFRCAFGLEGLSSLRSGTIPDPEPEAQGPPLGADGEMLVDGPFRFTRHGPNLAVIGVMWLQPRMTVNWLAVAIVASIYAVIGSLHEESRLRRAYGARYVRYQQQVPFMVPRIPRSLLGSLDSQHIMEVRR